ncbi:MAG TPA: hypothetical protein VF710_11225 [Longimicrobium sp.]|jgi:hypothetical protein
MPLYVHEVDATVDPLPPPSSGGAVLGPAQFAALVDAVVRELARRERDSASLRAETRITGTNRPAGG